MKRTLLIGMAILGLAVGTVTAFAIELNEQEKSSCNGPMAIGYIDSFSEQGYPSPQAAILALDFPPSIVSLLNEAMVIPFNRGVKVEIEQAGKLVATFLVREGEGGFQVDQAMICQ